MSATARAPQPNTPWAPQANSRTVLTARSGIRAVWRALLLLEQVTVWALSLAASLLVTAAASTAYIISAAYGVILTVLRRPTPSSLYDSWAARSLRRLSRSAPVLATTGPRKLGRLLFWLPKRLCRLALRGPFRLSPQRTQRLQVWRAGRRRPIRRHRSRNFRRLGHRRRQPRHEPHPRAPHRPRPAPTPFPAPPPFSAVGPQYHFTPDTVVALSLLGPYNNLPAASLLAGLWVITAYLNRGRSTPLPPSPPVTAAPAAGPRPHRRIVHHHATEPYGGGGSIPDEALFLAKRRTYEMEMKKLLVLVDVEVS